MGRPREFDVDEALRRAMDAFWAKGYEATSLTDLTKAMGVQKASLYGTFGDKHALFISALTRYAHDGIERLRTALDRPDAPLDAIRELFHAMVDNSIAPKGKRGCFCVNAAVELAPHDPAVGDIVREHVRRMEHVFAQPLERAHALGLLAKDVDVSRAAAYLVSLVFGLHVMSKSGPTRQKLRQVADTGLAFLIA
ncbi:MAG: TetR/AcrR family transcriptional regulator [Planctomycetes bacterium]|nr:TetR/AcrR family transcriptional regulator [Planctomycetota bacterium]